MTQEYIKNLIQQIEESKKIIGDQRDRLRDITYELETTLESIDMGLDDIHWGVHHLVGGVDKLSEVL